MDKWLWLCHGMTCNQLIHTYHKNKKLQYVDRKKERVAIVKQANYEI